MRMAQNVSLRMVVIFSAMLLASCANQQSAASGNANPSAKSYSGNELQKTGKRTSGEALQAADPAVNAR
jgi:hypothetical protein